MIRLLNWTLIKDLTLTLSSVVGLQFTLCFNIYWMLQLDGLIAAPSDVLSPIIGKH